MAPGGDVRSRWTSPVLLDPLRLPKRWKMPCIKCYHIPNQSDTPKDAGSDLRPTCPRRHPLGGHRRALSGTWSGDRRIPRIERRGRLLRQELGRTEARRRDLPSRVPGNVCGKRDRSGEELLWTPHAAHPSDGPRLRRRGRRCPRQELEPMGGGSPLGGSARVNVQRIDLPRAAFSGAYMLHTLHKPFGEESLWRKSRRCQPLRSAISEPRFFNA